jgi:hypothetical protein
MSTKGFGAVLPAPYPNHHKRGKLGSHTCLFYGVILKGMVIALGVSVSITNVPAVVKDEVIVDSRGQGEFPALKSPVECSLAGRAGSNETVAGRFLRFGERLSVTSREATRLIIGWVEYVMDMGAACSSGIL